MAQKFKVNRSEVLSRVREDAGVDLMSPTTSAEVETAIVVLDAIRLNGL